MLLEWFVRNVWGTYRAVAESDVDVIVPLTYGTYPDRLARGTEEALRQAIAHWRLHPEAIIAFANCPHCFPGSDVEERLLKWEVLQKEAIPIRNVLDAGGEAFNSVREALAIRYAFEKFQVAPRRILILAGKMHSRSVRLIWRRVFRRAEIIVRPISAEYEASHPLILMRTRWRWFLANILRHAALVVFGLTLSKYVKHPASVAKVS